MNLDAFLDFALKAPAGWERQALPKDQAHLRKLWGFFQFRDPGEGKLYPLGLSQDLGLWDAYKAARDKVELYAEGPQIPGCQADWLEWDEAKKRVTLGLFKPALPSACDRFVNRECPMMVGSGAEPSHPECNYWISPRFQEQVPNLELNPEWQRFDCHRYYRLFQCHLVVAELARSLGAAWNLHVAVDSGKPVDEIKDYSKLCSRPEGISFEVV